MPVGSLRKTHLSTAATSQPEPEQSGGAIDVTAEPTDDGAGAADPTESPSTGAEALEDVEWLTLTDTEHGFTIGYLSDWIVVDGGMTYGAVFRPYEGTQSTVYVEPYTSMFDDRTYDDYITEMIERLMRIDDTATYGERSAVEINGHPFTALEQQDVASDGETSYSKHSFTANGYGYDVHYSIPGSEYDAVAPTAEQILQSFTFAK